jgi:hypothetical protein
MWIGFPALSVWVRVTSQKDGRPVMGGCPGAVNVPVVFRLAASTMTLLWFSWDCR